MKEFLVIDVETTGNKAESDQVIELCIKYGLEQNEQIKVWRIKPDVPINPKAFAVHGISEEELAECKKFADYAEEIKIELESAKIICGYNVNFDLKFLQNEFSRLKQSLKLKEILIIDPYLLWRHFEPRDLSSAHKKFVGREFPDAHSAKEDVLATARVLEGMIQYFDLKNNSWEELSSLSTPKDNNWIGGSYHIKWSDDKENILFGFGKYNERSVLEVLNTKEGQGYLKWIEEKDFPQHVKKIIKMAASNNNDAFHAWIKSEFC